LVSFQIVDRQKFRGQVNEDGSLSDIRLIGKPKTARG
jgi:hypothetical protein